MAVMGTRLWGGLAGRNHNLPRLPPPGLPSQRDDNPSLDLTGLEPDPRITLLRCGHQVVKRHPVRVRQTEEQLEGGSTTSRLEPGQGALRDAGGLGDAGE